MVKYGIILRIANLFYKLAADRDYKEMLKINLSKLRETEQKPEDVEPREYYQGLSEKAEAGPIFLNHTLAYIKNLSDDVLPDKNRKQFIKWLANTVEKQKDVPPNNTLLHIKDYLNGSAEPINFEQLNHWDELYTAAEQWHNEEFYSKEVSLGDYKTNDVVYNFNNGYKVVSVSDSDDLKVEGDLMQHCVGEYYQEYLEEGEGNIYSLRDPSNKPHVTIRTKTYVDNYGDNVEEVSEIKGKQNAVPVEKYQDMIRQWLSKSLDKHRYLRCEDYLNIAGPEDVVGMLELATDDPDRSDDFLKRAIQTIYKNKIEITSKIAGLIARIFDDFEVSQEDFSHYGLQVQNILYIVNEPFMKDRADKIKLDLIRVDIDITEYGEQFKLFSPSLDDSPGIDKLREELVVTAAKQNPVKLMHTGYAGKYWPIVEPAAEMLFNAYINSEEIPNFGWLDSSNMLQILRYLPQNKIFSPKLKKGTLVYADRYVKQILKETKSGRVDTNDFEDTFLFEGTKIGETARPLAEVMKKPARYFNAGFHFVPELSDLTLNHAKHAAIESPDLFYTHDLLKYPELMEAHRIYAENIAEISPALFFQQKLHLMPEMEDYINNAKASLARKSKDFSGEKAAWLFAPTKGQYEKGYDPYTHESQFSNPNNYSSPEDFIRLVNKVVEYKTERNPRVYKDTKVVEALRNSLMRQYENNIRSYKNETRSNI